MILFGMPNGGIDTDDRAMWLTPPFNGGFGIAILGPYCVVASQAHTPGTVCSQAHVAGSVKEQAHVPGSVASKSC